MTAYTDSLGSCSGPGGGVNTSGKIGLGLGSLEGGLSSVQSPLTP